MIDVIVLGGGIVGALSLAPTRVRRRGIVIPLRTVAAAPAKSMATQAARSI